MSFTAALHTYFHISSIDKVTVEGLDGVTYTDSLQGGTKITQAGPVIFDREVDRIYLAAPDAAMKVKLGGLVCSGFVWVWVVIRAAGTKQTKTPMLCEQQQRAGVC